MNWFATGCGAAPRRKPREHRWHIHDEEAVDGVGQACMAGTGGFILCGMYCMCEGSSAVKLPEWLLKMKLWMAELASVISLGMILVWVLVHEYQTLFHH